MEPFRRLQDGMAVIDRSHDMKLRLEDPARCLQHRWTVVGEENPDEERTFGSV
jgi:hypothetical protein